MLSQFIFDGETCAEREAVVSTEESTTWGELRRLAHLVLERQQIARRRVGLSFRAAGASYAALAALEKLGCDAFLLAPDLSLEEASALVTRLKVGALLDWNESEFRVHEFPDETEWSGSGSVTILTSGSTGEPKAARHSWESLSRPIRTKTVCTAPRWLLTYRPNLYAGMQVALQCLADFGTLVVPPA